MHPGPYPAPCGSAPGALKRFPECAASKPQLAQIERGHWAACIRISPGSPENRGRGLIRNSEIAPFPSPFPVFHVCSTCEPNPTRDASTLFLMFPVFPVLEDMAITRRAHSSATRFAAAFGTASGSICRFVSVEVFPILRFPQVVAVQFDAAVDS